MENIMGDYAIFPPSIQPPMFSYEHLLNEQDTIELIKSFITVIPGINEVVELGSDGDTLLFKGNVIGSESGGEVVASIRIYPTYDDLEYDLPANTICVVIDASVDVNVTSGSAVYYYYKDENTWSLLPGTNGNLEVSWSDISSKPSSSIVDIDNSVSMKHEHFNSATLSKFSDVDGVVYYDGKKIESVGTVVSIDEW